jgi:hypothetical protein
MIVAWSIISSADARRNDRGYCARRFVDRHEIRKHRSHSLRIARQSHRDVECDAEASFRSDECTHEIISIVLARRAAELHDVAVRQQYGERDDVIRRRSVFQTMRSAGVLRDVAADRARGLTRRIRSVMKPLRCDGSTQGDVDHAGFDDGERIVRVDG